VLFKLLPLVRLKVFQKSILKRKDRKY